jgi:general secretion pathway protein L
MDFLIVEVHGHTIDVSRFHSKGKVLSFAGSVHRDLENEESIPLLLREYAAVEEAKGKIVLSLDPATIHNREMELPIRDRNKVREILPLELKGETAVDTDELIFDAVSLRSGKLLAVWAKRRDVAATIEVMTKAGAEPQIATSALFCWQSLLPENAGGYAALTDGTALAVYHDREPIYYRSLGEGELNRELEKTLAALEFGNGVKVEKVFLIGAASRADANSFAPVKSSGVSVSRLPISGELAGAFGNDVSTAAEAAGAWALARATLSAGTVNFRHGELAYTAGFERAKKQLRITAILVALLIVLLFAEMGTRYYLVKKDLDSINNSIRGMYHEVFPNRKKPVDEVAEIKSEIKRMGGGSADRNLLPALKKIAEIKGDGINGFFETEIEGNQVRLKGDAASFQAVNDFKMRAGSVFATADVGQIKSRPDGSVSFTFRGTLQEANK